MDKADAVPAVISETNPRNPTEILPESIPSEMSNQGGQDLVAAQVRCPVRTWIDDILIAL